MTSWDLTRFALFVLLAVLGAAPRASASTDSYIAGYAAAILEREFGLKSAKVTVKDGVVRVTAEELAESERDRIVTALAGIRGVTKVEVRRPDESGVPLEAPSTEAPPTARRESGKTEAEVERPTSVFLPKDKLFRPLIADPRWPHFSVAYLQYIDDEELKDVGSTSFGETFPIYRHDLLAGQGEFGFQAAVFAIFDLDARSKDLINADYFVGIPFTYRLDRFSALARVFHQSSHLGDEFLLRSRINRINLSYESVDLKISYELGSAVRLYGGGGVLFDQDPADLEPWSTQGGAELKSPWTFLAGVLRPIAAVDVQNREETDWDTDLSVRAGVELESPVLASTKVQLLADYFNGHSPNGQFFERQIESVGFGAHVHF
jgi:hypothetical protein